MPTLGLGRLNDTMQLIALHACRLHEDTNMAFHRMPLHRTTFLLACWLTASLTAVAQAQNDLGFDPSKKAADGSDLSEAEAAFQKAVSGATFVGSFTVKGKERGPGGLREERYGIKQVSKITGDVWRFDARVQYGGKDVTVPVPVSVKWAGDTPMIQVTNMSIPGLGDGFSARVLIYKDDYAGTWAHGKVGGHMFGRIERAGAERDDKADKDAQGKAGSSVGLPTAESAGPPPKPNDNGPNIVVNIDAIGRVSIRGQEVSMDTLAEKLKAAADGDLNRPVIIQADRKTLYQHAIEVLKVCRKVGLTQVGYASKSRQR